MKRAPSGATYSISKSHNQEDSNVTVSDRVGRSGSWLRISAWRDQSRQYLLASFVIGRKGNGIGSQGGARSFAERCDRLHIRQARLRKGSVWNEWLQLHGQSGRNPGWRLHLASNL